MPPNPQRNRRDLAWFAPRNWPYHPPAACFQHDPRDTDDEVPSSSREIESGPPNAGNSRVPESERTTHTTRMGADIQILAVVTPRHRAELDGIFHHTRWNIRFAFTFM